MKVKTTIRYSPSWVNRLTAFIRQLPFSDSAKYFLILAIYLTLFGFLSRWIAGQISLKLWSTYQIYDVISGPLLVALVLFFSDYLEKEIGEALDRTQTLVNYSDEALSDIKYRMITLPARPTLVMSVVFFLWTIPGFLFEYGFSRITFGSLLLFLDWGITSVLTFIFIVRLIRFIFQIRRFYEDLPELNLFNLAGIYDLPSLAAKAGLFLMIIWYSNLPFNLNDLVLNTPFYFGTAILVSLIPIGAFLIPFGSLNRRLVREKKKEIVQVSLHIQSAFQQVDERIRQGSFEQMSDMKAVISNLITKRDFLEAIPTWPWREGTFRITLTAVLLPLIVWFMQQLLDRLFGF